MDGARDPAVRRPRAHPPAGRRRRATSAALAYFRDGAVRDRRRGTRPRRVLESVVDGSGRAAYRCRIRLDPRAAGPARSSRPRARARCSSTASTRSPRCSRATGSRAASDAGDAAARRRGARCSRRRARGRAGARRRSRSASSCVSACGAAPRRGRRCASRARRRAGCTSTAPTCSSGSARWSAARGPTPGSRAASRGTSLRRPGHAYEPAQARWFAELHSIAPRHARCSASFSDVVGVAHARRHRVAPALAAPRGRRDHGIPLVPTKKHTTVTLARDAATVAARRAHARRTRARAAVAIDGERRRRRGRCARSATSASTGSTVRRERIDLTLAAVAAARPGARAPHRARAGDRARRRRRRVPPRAPAAHRPPRRRSTRPASTLPRRPSARRSS